MEIKDIMGDMEMPTGFPDTFGDELTKNVQTLIDNERNGVRQSEQQNQKTLTDENALLKAQVQDLQSEDTLSGSGEPKTELGKRTAAIKAQQDQERSEAQVQRRINEAVQAGRDTLLAQVEAKQAGVPQELIDQAGDDPKSLAMAVTMHKLYGDKSTNNTGSDTLSPSGSQSGSAPPNTTQARVDALVDKLTPITGT